MWQDILKVQVLDTSTGLSTINEPMIEDKDCCERAKEALIEYFIEAHPGHYPIGSLESFEEYVELVSCQNLKDVLDYTNQKRDSYLNKKNYYWVKARDVWEECENE